MRAEHQQQGKGEGARQQQSRTRAHPAAAAHPPAAALRRLHRGIGNRAVGRLMQTDPQALVGAVLREEGRPLDAPTRAFMETRFGHDFGHVRVHTGERADASAAALGALAYTVRERVVFRRAAYAPATEGGRRLIAHELAHVLQQSGGNVSAQAHAPTSVSRPSDDAEREAEHAADAALSGRAEGRVRVAARPPVIARQMVVEPLAPEPVADTADASWRGRKWATSFAVVKAILNIIHRTTVLRDGLKIDVSEPRFHPEVPAAYQPLLEDWYFITNEVVRRPSGIALPATGALMRDYIRETLEKTRPLLDMLLSRADRAEVRRWLEQEFYSRVAEFERRAVREEVSEEIEAGVKGGAVTDTAFVHAKVQEEGIKIGLEKALDTVRSLNTTVNRFNTSALKNIKESLDHQLKSQKLLLAAGIYTSLGHLTGMSVKQLLWYIKGALDGLKDIVALTDPVKRAKKFKEWSEGTEAIMALTDPRERAAFLELHRTTVAGTIARTVFVRGMDVMTQIGQALFGYVALYQLVIRHIALAKGWTAVAVQMLAGGVKRLQDIQLGLNVIGMFHGAAVLLDDEASKEEKSSAVSELLISAIGVAAKVGTLTKGVLGRVGPYLKWVSRASGYLTAAVIAGQVAFAVRDRVKTNAERWDNWVRVVLNGRFQDMSRTAQRVEELALKIGFAAELRAHEEDPLTRQELDRQGGQLKDALASAIEGYLRRVTTPRGAGYDDQASIGPAIGDRFRPLADHKLNTVGETLDAAAVFLALFVKSFAERNQILEEVKTWMRGNGEGPHWLW